MSQKLMTRLQVDRVCAKEKGVRLKSKGGALRMLALHNALQQEGTTNMTHQQGGGIPHAWLLTKHEMFMLSVYGRVCG